MPGTGRPGTVGSSGRGRRVPPRVGQHRRGAPRAAQGEGGRRWWFVALGTLAVALVLPRLAWGQGLRSSPASITLVVTAPPHLRSGASAARRDVSVADVIVRLPVATFDVAHIDARLEDAPVSGAALYVRTSSGALLPVNTQWAPVAPGATPSFPVLTQGGTPLPAGRWRVRFRLSPRDAAHPALDVQSDIVVPGC